MPAEVRDRPCRSSTFRWCVEPRGSRDPAEHDRIGDVEASVFRPAERRTRRARRIESLDGGTCGVENARMFVPTGASPPSASASAGKPVAEANSSRVSPRWIHPASISAMLSALHRYPFISTFQPTGRTSADPLIGPADRVCSSNTTHMDRCGCNTYFPSINACPCPDRTNSSTKRCPVSSTQITPRECTNIAKYPCREPGSVIPLTAIMLSMCHRSAPTSCAMRSPSPVAAALPHTGTSSRPRCVRTRSDRPRSHRCQYDAAAGVDLLTGCGDDTGHRARGRVGHQAGRGSVVSYIDSPLV